jgi:hypothetical protein
MHPYLTQAIAEMRIGELRREAAAYRLARLARRADETERRRPRHFSGAGVEDTRRRTPPCVEC